MTTVAAPHSSWRRWSPMGWSAFTWKSALAAHLAVPPAAMLGSIARGGCGVITYHRVAEETAGISKPTLNVTPELFRRQLEGLLRRGYRPIQLRELTRLHRAGRDAPRKSFVVAFDDGYQNIYTRAWPILRELNIPATVFMPTAFLDSRRKMPFDDWRHAGSPKAPPESWRTLTTRQCQLMAADGLIEFGTHTHTHQDFRNRPEDFRRDMEQSLQVFQDKLGWAAESFAYPFGFIQPEMADITKELGLDCCLNSEPRLVTKDCDPYHWGRFGATEFDTPATLSSKLSGWFSFLRGVWRRLQLKRVNERGAGA